MQQEHDLLTIRFCGDSGDGIQLIGEQLMMNAALCKLEVRTLPDYPAEIRAPAGTVSGVSGVQLAISGHRIEIAGDKVDVLVALNPAALVHAIADLAPNAIVIINSCQFTDRDWQKAQANPDILTRLNVIQAPINALTQTALAALNQSSAQTKRCKNFFILGVMLWLLELSLDTGQELIANKFSSRQALRDANQLALAAGYHYGMTMDMQRPYFIKNLPHQHGNYRQINGAEAIGLALATLATQCHQNIFVAGYPITPSSVILHECAKLADFNIDLFQAEDEIAAICACLGAAFGGKLALTTTSGPGFDLKMEGLGLAVVSELPLVVLDVQRAGASTGLPTKTSQSDLRQALYGRHGESPLPILAASSPSNCFDIIIEAFDIAIKYMTPVVVLLDAYLMNASEPWLIPDLAQLKLPQINHYQHQEPFKRNALGSRSWNPPGQADFIHQLGGLEKQGDWGKVSYDANNHQNMTKARKFKIDNIGQELMPVVNLGKPSTSLVITWGSTYGVMKTALDHLVCDGLDFSWIHLRNLSPFPANLGDFLQIFDEVNVFELNSGHLCDLLRAHYLIDAKAITQCNGKPFSSQFIIDILKESNYVINAQ